MNTPNRNTKDEIKRLKTQDSSFDRKTKFLLFPSLIEKQSLE
jgi:hypothetical protein